MLNPEFSIVIPVLNGEAVIARCLSSLCSQGVELEIIVMDGLSSDATVSKIREFPVPPNVKIIIKSQKDNGAADAINRGFAIANGSILGWIGCDDELTENALQHVSKIFRRNIECNWVVGHCQRRNSQNIIGITKPTISQIDKVYLTNPIDQPSSFWRRELFQQVGGLSNDYKFAFDWDLWCKFSKLGEKPIIITEVLSVYWFSEDNLTSVGGLNQLKEQIRVPSKYYKKSFGKYLELIFMNFDMKNKLPNQIESNFINKLMFRVVNFAGLILFGSNFKEYHLYWLANQMKARNE